MNWAQEIFHNLQRVQELRKPPTGRGTESGAPATATWKWFSLMDEAIGGRPSIRLRPHCLSLGREPFHLGISLPDSVPSEPGPSKWQWCDPILELLEREEERAEERARKEEAREERLLNLLEKIVEKM